MKSSHATLTFLCFLLLASPAFAQDPPAERVDGETTSDSDSVKRRNKRDTSRDRRRAEGRRPDWSFDVSLRNLYDTNVLFSPRDLSSYGLEGVAVARYENHRSWPTFTGEYGIARHWYEATDVWNRTSHNLRLAGIKRSDDRRWRFETVGQIQIKGWTVDRELADIYSLSPRLDFLPSPRDRFRLYGAYRLKRYDVRDFDDDLALGVGRNSTNPYAGVEYRRSNGEGSQWELGYRAEYNDADSDFYDYRRQTWSTSYTLAIGPRDRIEAALDYRIREYEDRLVSGSQNERRKDVRIVPSARWSHDLGERLRLDLDYVYDQQASNEVLRDFDAHRLALTTRYRW